MSGTAATTRSVGTALVALVVGLLAVLAPPTAEAATGPLLYTCSGSNFGSTPPYGFQVIVDTDLPAALPYGAERVTTWTTQLVAPESFRSWAQSQGFTTLYAGARLGTALDGAAQLVINQTSGPLAVPATAGPWTWTTSATTTQVVASAVGHHAFTVTSLEVTVAFHDANGPRLATSATCVLDPADTTVDTYDVVAAATTTVLALKGDKATATVTSNGAEPLGTVAFSVGGKSVKVEIVSPKATATLPKVPPGVYTVSAEFVPTQPSQMTPSTGTASYAVPRIPTKSHAFASYRPARSMVRARARVAAADGSDVSGRVKLILKRNGRTTQVATVWLTSRDVATKRFRGIPPSGKYLVVAKYLGTGTFEPSADRARFTLP